MKIRNFIFLPILFSCLIHPKMTQAHPFYVSMCQVDFDKQKSMLEISVKIFTDDLLVALENKGYHNLYLGEENEDSLTSEYIQTYLKENLIFYIDDSPLTWSYIGKEKEDDATWIYLEVPNISNFTSIKITDSILTDTFETQNNIVQVNKNGRRLALLLNRQKPTDELKW